MQMKMIMGLVSEVDSQEKNTKKHQEKKNVNCNSQNHVPMHERQIY